MNEIYTLNKKHLKAMLEQIEKYQVGLITLRTMHENLWNLFEMINDSNEFSVVFHQYWDHVEEIIAVEKLDMYQEEVSNVIILNFKQQILAAVKRNNKDVIHNKFGTGGW